MPRVTITVPDRNPQPYRFPLENQEVTLGRGSENDIVIESTSVSTSHARMVRVRGGYELHDAGSTNGMKLAGEPRQVIELASGLDVELGDVAFDFQLSPEEVEALEREKPQTAAPALLKEAQPAGPNKPPEAVRTIVIRTERGGMGFFGALLFLILAVVAFLVGVEIRHQKETGRSLFEAAKAKCSKPVVEDSPPVEEAPPAVGE